MLKLLYSISIVILQTFLHVVFKMKVVEGMSSTIENQGSNFCQIHKKNLSNIN